MSNEAMSLTSYDAAGRRVRALVIDGSPWLVGADILRALFGTAKSKGNAYLKLADDEHRRVHRGNLGLHAGRAMALVSESGFYKLVMRSDKPDALAFQEWVTREVLPAIRRTGG